MCSNGIEGDRKKNRISRGIQEIDKKEMLRERTDCSEGWLLI